MNKFRIKLRLSTIQLPSYVNETSLALQFIADPDYMVTHEETGVSFCGAKITAERVDAIISCVKEFSVKESSSEVVNPVR